MKKKRFLVRSPEQGLKVIQHPTITRNYKKALRWTPQHKNAVLVPCAQTKPFPEAPSHRDGYLQALDGKDVDVWVVSEPLGVVPYAWSRDYPNGHYDFPPQHLRDRAHDVLAGRITRWFNEVGPKYKKITLALPRHHMKLVDKALDMLGHEPTKIVYAGIGDCLDSGACPKGHYRANSHAYRKFLKRRANPPNPRLYHRSPRQVDEFDPKRMRFGDYGPGFYFSEAPAEEHAYGRWLHEADVDVKNPLDLENADPAVVSKILRSLRIESEYIMPDGGPPLVQAMGLVQTLVEAGMYSPAAVIKVLEHYGYDGIVVPSKGYWSAFRPEQIKVQSARRTNPIRAEWGRNREPVDVLAPAYPGSMKDWQARFVDDDEGVVLLRASELYMPGRDTPWHTPKPPPPQGPYGLDRKPNPIDPRRRSAERSWRETGDPAAAMAYFQELVRQDVWSAMSYPDLFWALLKIPGGPEVMWTEARRRRGWEDGWEVVRPQSKTRRGAPLPMHWEVDERPYTFLRAYQLGYEGRIEAWNADDSQQRPGVRGHVAASNWAPGYPSSGTIAVPGLERGWVLVWTAGPTVKKYAGKQLKTRRSGDPIYFFPWARVRIMNMVHARGGRIRWKNPPEACGDCYKAAFEYLMDSRKFGIGLGGQDLRLVHANVHGQGPLEGRVIDHAWVEETIVPELPAGVRLPPGIGPEDYAVRVAIDRSQGRDIQMPVAMYRGIGGAHDVREYTWEEASKLASKTGHYGPWHVDLNPPRRTLEDFRRAWEEGGGAGELQAYMTALSRAGREVPLRLHGELFWLQHGNQTIVTKPKPTKKDPFRTKKLAISQGYSWLWRRMRSGDAYPFFYVRTLPSGRCYLRINFDSGEVYESVFEDCTVLWTWLQNKWTFEDAPLDWDGRSGVVSRRMHPSTFGHPAGSEGGPDAQCWNCRSYYWSGDPDAHPDQPECPTCYARRQAKAAGAS